MIFDVELEEVLESFDIDDDRETFSDSISYLRNIHTLHTNLVMIAFDAGVLEDINDEYSIDSDFVEEHIETLISDFGLTKQNATWVVETLCKIYGGNVLALDLDFLDDDGDDFDSDDDVPNNVSGDSVCLAYMREGEKLPKSIIQRIPSAERNLGIDDLTLTITADGSFGDEDEFKVTGEIISDSLTADVVIFIMAYNEDNQLIGCSFNERIDKDECNGFASFSKTVYIPKGETITRIVVRPVQNPAGFW